MHIALTQPLCYNVAYDIRMSLLPRRNQSALCAFGKFLWVRAYKVFDLRPGISLHADGDENGRQASMGTLQVRSLLRPPHAGLNCLIAWGGSIRYYLYYRLLDHMILAACASRRRCANRPFAMVPRGLSPTPAPMAAKSATLKPLCERLDGIWRKRHIAWEVAPPQRNAMLCGRQDNPPSVFPPVDAWMPAAATAPHSITH